MFTHSIMTSLIIGAYVVLLIVPVSPKNVVCYFLNWAQYRPAPCSHTVRNINPFLCTHGVYAFSKLDGNRIAPTEWNDDTPTGQWRQFNDLKKINPNFKTLLSVGGYLHGSYRFHLMAKSQANRAEFISSTIALLRNWTFDGLDIDWEYPGNDSPDDMSYLTDLLKELREAFHQESISSKRSPLLVSVAVASGVWQASSSYNVTSLDQYIDMVYVMTYDYHGFWQKTTGLNAPMFSNDGLDVHSTITWYTNNGLRADKIFLGIALYGRTWTLADPSLNGVGAPAVDSGIAGNCTKEKGTLAYFEICDLLRNKGYTETLDYIGQQKYAYNGDQWVSYDDKQSLNIKMDYINGFNLGGAMVWALSDDDFSGQFCGEGNYSILGYVTSRLSDKSTTFSTTVTSTTKIAFSTAAETTTVTTTTATTKPTSTMTTTIPTTTPTSTTTKPTTLTTLSTTTTTSPSPTTTTKPTTTTTTSTNNYYYKTNHYNDYVDHFNHNIYTNNYNKNYYYNRCANNHNSTTNNHYYKTNDYIDHFNHNIYTNNHYYKTNNYTDYVDHFYHNIYTNNYNKSYYNHYANHHNSSTNNHYYKTNHYNDVVDHFNYNIYTNNYNNKANYYNSSTNDYQNIFNYSVNNIGTNNYNSKTNHYNPNNNIDTDNYSKANQYNDGSNYCNPNNCINNKTNHYNRCAHYHDDDRCANNCNNKANYPTISTYILDRRTHQKGFHLSEILWFLR
ncbi:acidic mammalian chitinase [Biomphalaria pfeifferi]|uniref:Acidic mammalian chitinase n=1 Tax=Biomphalaria pfeifferi TaxID=112525 RepID=A0AAD8F2E0_BIOPF|nr:acidic mammalian chitinase [Biomphalaria pfeifferi]